MFVSTKDPQGARENIKAILEQAGIMPTSQRIEIALIMLGCPQHLSADQLLALVNCNGAGVSKATIYNTLGLFARKGIIREVLVDPNRIFYDSNTDDHCHVYNEDTGTLTDVSINYLPPATLPPLPEGTTLVDIDVIIRVRNNNG